MKITKLIKLLSPFILMFIITLSALLYYGYYTKKQMVSMIEEDYRGVLVVYKGDTNRIIMCKCPIISNSCTMYLSNGKEIDSDLILNDKVKLLKDRKYYTQY